MIYENPIDFVFEALTKPHPAYRIPTKGSQFFAGIKLADIENVDDVFSLKAKGKSRALVDWVKITIPVEVGTDKFQWFSIPMLVVRKAFSLTMPHFWHLYDAHIFD